LPACPNCGTTIATPAKVFTVIVEPKEGERGHTQRKVGMYQCEKCGTKFPTVVSRQHYLVVADDQLKQIRTDLSSLKKTNQDLEKKIKAMDKEYEDLQKALDRNKRDMETRVLEAKVQALENHVAYLRKEKEELEGKAAKFR
jgi:predicted RNase H-like nuclease (RuvC/YqgF family)